MPDTNSLLRTESTGNEIVGLTVEAVRRLRTAYPAIIFQDAEGVDKTQTDLLATVAIQVMAR